jgi:hypothetical protein
MSVANLIGSYIQKNEDFASGDEALSIVYTASSA